MLGYLVKLGGLLLLSYLLQNESFLRSITREAMALSDCLLLIKNNLRRYLHVESDLSVGLLPSNDLHLGSLGLDFLLV